jgi:hypothetical protein
VAVVANMIGDERLDLNSAIGLARGDNTEQQTESLLQGAVLFTSVISCLSWTNIDSRHWTGPALWYCSILLAIASVVLAAQQHMVLENIRVENWKTVQTKFAEPA